MGCGGSKKSDVQSVSNKSSGGSSTNASRETDKKAAKEGNHEFMQTMSFLSNVQLFKRLPKDEHPILATNFVRCDFKNGEVIIQQGDEGKEFFIIKQGEASVTVKKGDDKAMKVATLKSGDYFGENALLRDEPRSATITADQALSTLKITRDKFKELGLHEKLAFANRQAVVAGGKRKIDVKPPSPKDKEEKALIREALVKNENLQTMINLDEQRIEAMMEVAWKENVPKGTDIIKEGDLTADYFYIVQEGSFKISITDQLNDGQPQAQSAENTLNKGESKFVSTVTKGGSFGELALLYLVPRAATVKATVDSIVWVIDRLNFKKIIMKVSDTKVKEYTSYLERVEILEPLLAEEKRAVAEALTEMHFVKGEIVLQEGEAGNTFYILYEGEVSVTKQGMEQPRLKASQTEGAKIFGERALLNNDVRAATVTVVSECAKSLVLDRSDFDLLLGPLSEIIKRAQQGGKRASMLGKGGHQWSNPNDKQRTRIKKGDLTKLGLLGCGGFGSVELVQHKTSKETYAMKALSKGFVVKTGMQESVMNEKNILMMTSSPFIIRLWETYNGQQNLYFLLEPALGGELYATYNRKGFHGSEKHAKFYVAGVVEGFAHMHERRIIYRDLKPENLLLNDAGQLKITDMGLAKFVIGHTYTTCGTPDYFAPELIASSGHTNAVDWWTLGILIFELMSGHPPFESAYPMQIYSKVMKGINKVPFPQKCQGPVGDLIKSLLKREPSERLPMRTGSIQNIRDHAWFKDFSWASFKSLTLDPPYKPQVKGKNDLTNFNARKEDMPRQIEYHDDGSGWDAGFATFTS